MMELEKLKQDLLKMPPDRDMKVNYVKGWLVEHGNNYDPAAAYCLIDETSQKLETQVYILTDSEGNQTLGLAKLASDLLVEYYFATMLDTEEILVYKDGVYRSNAVKLIREECQRRVGVTALLTEHKVNEIIGHIKRSTYTKRELFNQSSAIINVENGLLDVFSRVLKPAGLC